MNENLKILFEDLHKNELSKVGKCNLEMEIRNLCKQNEVLLDEQLKQSEWLLRVTQENKVYKDKEDKLREFLENEPNDLYSTISTKKYWVIDILQILNEGEKE